MNISCIYGMYLCMLWEVAISFTLMGGGHPFTLIYTYIKCNRFNIQSTQNIYTSKYWRWQPSFSKWKG